LRPPKRDPRHKKVFETPRNRPRSRFWVFETPQNRPISRSGVFETPNRPCTDLGGVFETENRPSAGREGSLRPQIDHRPPSAGSSRPPTHARPAGIGSSSEDFVERRKPIEGWTLSRLRSSYPVLDLGGPLLRDCMLVLRDALLGIETRQELARQSAVLEKSRSALVHNAPFMKAANGSSETNAAMTFRSRFPREPRIDHDSSKPSPAPRASLETTAAAHGPSLARVPSSATTSILAESAHRRCSGPSLAESEPA
jgi:hypothetical protein